MILQLAIGKECLFEGSTLETRCQARLLVMNHIVIHTDRIVLVHVTLFHHFIRAAQDFDNAPAVPGICIADTCAKLERERQNMRAHQAHTHFIYMRYRMH
jgi:hypothetical protein